MVNRILVVLTIFCSFTQYAQAQWPASVKKLTVGANATITETGALENGTLMPDLNWALKPTVGCFSATDSRKFKGHHVIYGTTLSAKTILDIKVTPKDRKTKLSVYAYLINTDEYSIPPGLVRCVSCRQDSQGGALLPGNDDTGERKVRLNAIQKGFNAVIVVCGEEGVDKGAYTLTLTTIQ